nr:superoxide dismutase family protein [Actinomycetota bacterium]
MSEIGMRGPTIVGVALAAITAGALMGGSAVAQPPRGLIATMRSAAGAPIGTVRVIPSEDGKTIVRATGAGLTEGFHGFHVHSVGVCDPVATDPNGTVVPFFSAGGHFNPDATKTHGAHAGDMSPLLAASDGSASLRLKTDRFKPRDLLDEDGSVIIMHAGPDNLGHIPAASSTGAERYHSHVDDVFGADTLTKATGDAGPRFACGVLT